jgi:hypothetical protein
MTIILAARKYSTQFQLTGSIVWFRENVCKAIPVDRVMAVERKLRVLSATSSIETRSLRTWKSPRKE